MNETNIALLLKVLSGPHTGAEMLLPGERVVIGRALECDVTLSDQMIASQHAELEIQSGRLILKTIGDAVAIVDGVAVQEAVLKPYQIFVLGGTQMAVGSSKEQWPDITVDFGSLVEKKTGEVDGPLKSETPPLPKPDGQVSASNQHKSSYKISPILLTLVASALLLVGLPMVVAIVAGFGGESAQVGEENLRQQVVSLISQAKYENAQLTVANDHDRLTVEGFLRSKDDQRVLESELREFSAEIMLRVANSEKLADAAQKVLEFHEYQCVASPGGPGEVVINGTTDGSLQWSNIEQAIKKDVPRIGVLTNQLRSVSIERPVVGSAEEPAVVIVETPLLPPIAPEEAESIAAEEVSESFVEPISLAVKSVSVGAVKSVVLDSGERIFVGGRLQSGHELTTITPEFIELMKDGRQFTVSLGTERNE